MTLKELRKLHKLSQAECAQYLGIPRRTYQNYETDPSKATSFKYLYMVQKLQQYGLVDESHGVLTLDKIKDVCAEVFESRNIEYCYLFGSYAKGQATDTSDVDLLVYTTVSGLKFYGLVEELREKLKKKVDVLDQKQIADNFELTNEILKDGIKLYG